MISLATPFCGEDISAIVSAPVIKGTFPTIKGDEYSFLWEEKCVSQTEAFFLKQLAYILLTFLVNGSNSGATNQMRVFPVYGFQLLAHCKSILFGFLRHWFKPKLFGTLGTRQSFSIEFGPMYCVEGESHRRLQHLTLALGVSNRMQIFRVHQPPKIIFRIRSVEPQTYSTARFSNNSGNAIALRSRILSL